MDQFWARSPLLSLPSKCSATHGLMAFVCLSPKVAGFLDSVPSDPNENEQNSQIYAGMPNVRRLGELTTAQLSARASLFQLIFVHTGTDRRMSCSEKRFLCYFFNLNFHFAHFIKSRTSVKYRSKRIALFCHLLPRVFVCFKDKLQTFFI